MISCYLLLAMLSDKSNRRNVATSDAPIEMRNVATSDKRNVATSD